MKETGIEITTVLGDTAYSEKHADQEAFQNTERVKQMTSQRYKIEANNSELKNRHGYDTTSGTGLFSMQIQGATTIFAVNLK